MPDEVATTGEVEELGIEVISSHFRMSKPCDKLIAALAAAQLEYQEVEKNREVDFLTSRGDRTNYKYADLENFYGASRPSLNKQGIAVIQPAGCDGKVSVTTMLAHKSGQWMANDLNMAMEAKTLGSLISYGRRYSFIGMAGIASREHEVEDVDGQLPLSPAEAKKAQKAVAEKKIEELKSKPAAAREATTTIDQEVRPAPSTKAVVDGPATVAFKDRWRKEATSKFYVGLKTENGSGVLSAPLLAEFQRMKKDLRILYGKEQGERVYQDLLRPFMPVAHTAEPHSDRFPHMRAASNCGLDMQRHIDAKVATMTAAEMDSLDQDAGDDGYQATDEDVPELIGGKK